MLLLTATAIGFCAGLMRSAFAVALSAMLVVLTFVAASALSNGPWIFGNLLIAILGYNLGIINLLAGMVLIDRLRSA